MIMYDKLALTSMYILNRRRWEPLEIYQKRPINPTRHRNGSANQDRDFRRTILTDQLRDVISPYFWACE
jgi:hypothetical protein